MIACQVLNQSPYAYLLEVGDGKSLWIAKHLCKQIDEKVFVSESVLAEMKLSLENNRFGNNVYHLKELYQSAMFAGACRLSFKPNREYQQMAFERLHGLRYWGLYMQMRAGKTKVAIDIMCHHIDRNHIDKVWWLCPNSTIATAQEQWNKFAVLDVQVQFTALETISGCGSKRLQKILDFVDDRTGIIIDESQMIKNHRANRCRRLDKIILQAPVRGLLSGTPITKNIQDLYNQMRFLNWRILSYANYHQFQKHHLIMSSKIPGLVHDVMNVDYLVERISPFVYEYFSPTEKMQREARYVELSERQKQMTDYVKSAFIEKLSSYTERRSDVYVFFVILQNIMTGYLPGDVLGRFLNKPCRNIYFDNPKLNILNECLHEADEKTLIWCTRRIELAQIRAYYPDAITVSGEQNADERHACIQAFRTSKKSVLAAMMPVAKRGIEISECNNVIYLSHGFDYESRVQSQHRTLLLDKKAICRYTDMIYLDSLDERMLAAHSKKSNIVSEFIRMLKENREQAIKEVEQL